VAPPARLATVIVSFALMGVACGGGSSRTVREGPWVIRLSDEAAIHKVMLLPSDAPPGWTKTGSVSRHPAQVKPSKRLLPCLGTPSPDIHETAYLTSEEFADPHDTIQASSVGIAYDNAKWIEQNVRDAVGTKGVSCARSAAEYAAPILHQRGVVVAITEPPPGSAVTLRYVTTTTYQDVTSGAPVDTVGRSFTVASGRYMAVVNIEARGVPIPAADEQMLVSAVARRLPAGS
jgi:hypothetical protein